MPTETLSPSEEIALLKKQLASAERINADLQTQVAAVTDGEVAAAVQLLTQEKMAAGLTREQARDVALRQVVEDANRKERDAAKAQREKEAKEGASKTDTDLAEERAEKLGIKGPAVADTIKSINPNTGQLVPKAPDNKGKEPEKKK